MYTFILVLHIIIAIFLVIAVLVQSGKGGGLGAGFGGGGANTLFGSSGGSNFFTKLTMGLAAAFMCTSLILTVVRTKSVKSSIFDQSKAPISAPTTNAPAADASATTSSNAAATGEATPTAPNTSTEKK